MPAQDLGAPRGAEAEVERLLVSGGDGIHDEGLDLEIDRCLQDIVLGYPDVQFARARGSIPVVYYCNVTGDPAADLLLPSGAPRLCVGPGRIKLRLGDSR